MILDMLMKKATTTAVLFITGLFSIATAQAGDFRFEPLSTPTVQFDWNPGAPWVLPEGFEQKLVSGERTLNIYGWGRDDWNDMNTVNESGDRSGRYLYRTHEVRRYPEGGAVSVVDLETGETKVLHQDASWVAIDGIRWSPWKTLLVAEETSGGRFFEILLNDDLLSVKRVIQHDAVGRLAHEGIDIDADGNVYVVDEWRGQSKGCGKGAVKPCGGGIYKFVPDQYGDLSSGKLYVLKVDGEDGTGQGEWVGPIDPLMARRSGTEHGGSSYQRPEDLEIIGKHLYVAITEGSRDEFGDELYDGRIVAIDLNSLTVTNFVKPGVNAPVQQGKPGGSDYVPGLDNPDNLAEAPDGRLVIIEDNLPSKIWFAEDKSGNGIADEVLLFGLLTDPEAEGTGIYFSPLDPRTLYVNIQHSAAEDGDGTWAITRNSKKKWKRKDD
jgi:hypothetical protein